MDTIYNKLIELRKKQEALAFDYEEKASYEMAYLSWWYVLEKILKIMDAEYRKKHLYRQVCEWKKYLENHNPKKPNDFKSFNLTELENTPDIGKIGKIEEHLDCELPIIKEIMNTNQKNGSKKWRDKRRDIAHGAAPFREKETYEEYRHKIMEGISEIERALNVIASDTSKSQARSQLSRFPKRDQATA